MRSWRLFRGSAPDNDQQQQQQQSQQSNNTTTAASENVRSISEGLMFRPFSSVGTSRSNTVGNVSNDQYSTAGVSSSDFLSGLRSTRQQNQHHMEEVQIEQAVRDAARSLGDSVQRIVLAAKSAQGHTSRDDDSSEQDDDYDVTNTDATSSDSKSDWKLDLLTLLGGIDVRNDTDESTSSKGGIKSYVQILLDHKNTPFFVDRCIEHELPPNLIHCLRLLRVLELQYAAMEDLKDVNGHTVTEDTPATHIPTPEVSQKAGRQVSRLLCSVCTTPSVGEQLRPHLFGWLALSGASYPPRGVHVAHAAADGIRTLAQHALTRQLVWFMHDRKMIWHMTDDIKELCEFSNTGNDSGESSDTVLEEDDKIQDQPLSSQENSDNKHKGLTGTDAEKAGLWAVALSTVVLLVEASGRFVGSELIRDFEAAGGYKVLHFAIKHATVPHGRQLIELLPKLVCCGYQSNSNRSSTLSNALAIDTSEQLLSTLPKVAVNDKALEILKALLARSNPILCAYGASDGNSDKYAQPNLDRASSLAELAQLSLDIVTKKVTETVPDKFGFDIDSELLNVTLQLFSDHTENYDIIEGQQHILSFYLLSFPIYRDNDLKVYILKTLEFILTGVGVTDEVTPVFAYIEMFFAACNAIVQGSDVREKIPSDAISSLLADANLMGGTLEKLLQFDQRVAPIVVESGILGSSLKAFLDTILEKIEKARCRDNDDFDYLLAGKAVSTACRVLRLVASHQPTTSSKLATDSSVDETKEDEKLSNLHLLLKYSALYLLSDAVYEAASVFESYLVSFVSYEGLKQDIEFVLQLLETIGRETSENESSRHITIERQVAMINMLRNVVESRVSARDAYRECEGYEVLIHVLSENKLPDSNTPLREEVMESLSKLLHSVLSLVDASTNSKPRKFTAQSSILTMPNDVDIDSLSLQMSTKSPAYRNINYLRNNGFYLNLASCLALAGLLNDSATVESIILLAYQHMDSDMKDIGCGSRINYIRNPDAFRLLLGIVHFLPHTDGNNVLTFNILDDLLTLCGTDRITTTLPQFSSCGACWSLCHPREFGPMLFDDKYEGRVHSLLQRIASFSMSYQDCLNMLRYLCGPYLSAGSADGRIRLPIINSSVNRKSRSYIGEKERAYKAISQYEAEHCRRLSCLSATAEQNNKVSRISLGGDSINTIAVLMHKFPMQERLKQAAIDGRLKYLEISSVNASSMVAESNNSYTTSTSANDQPWNATSTTGFSFSCWMRYESKAELLSQAGSLFVLDLHSPLLEGSDTTNTSFMTVWYDIQKQQFNALTSASYRGEPTSFPVCHILPDTWHHVLITYSPAKRSVITRKSVLTIYVDGRRLEAEVKIDSVVLPPTARCLIGCPNTVLAVSGIIRGKIQSWDAGPLIMFSTILLDLDATAIYSYGPEFPGILWGDRPQHLSLAATAACLFPMLTEVEEVGSVASLLRRRDVAKLESAGYSTLGEMEKDSLASVNLLCNIPPECLIFAFSASSMRTRVKNENSRDTRRLTNSHLVNIARLDFANEYLASDAILHGRCYIIPLNFADNLQWAGGPFLILPLLYKACTLATTTLSLQILRHCTSLHRPNLEAMQAGGGYRVMSILLQEKTSLDERALTECIAFAIYGFRTTDIDEVPTSLDNHGSAKLFSNWIISDIDAMKYLLLNHQIWDLRKLGPSVPLRMLDVLNCLVHPGSIHKAFNARRMHMIDIIVWALHLMIEAALLYTTSDERSDTAAWKATKPLVLDVAIGAELGNDFLRQCKTLLRRVLTFMLTPGDLESLADAIIYTITATNNVKRGPTKVDATDDISVVGSDTYLSPHSMMRLYLVRLLEELIVDGVNEIIVSKPSSSKDPNVAYKENSQPHSGGVASLNQQYLSLAATKGRMSGVNHPKHQQAQSFLSAFAAFLTPVWFATLLEGCEEEASASAALRLLVLMLQNCSSFEVAFVESGGFSPFVLSIPRFATCPGIVTALLSYMLNAPILHLHSFAQVDSDQLFELFDSEADGSSPIWHHETLDPSSGIFGLITECIGRNFQLTTSKSHLSGQANNVNRAMLELISHRYPSSVALQSFCATPAFLEPLSQALCLVYDEHLQSSRSFRTRRRSFLSDVPKDLSPTERYVGGPLDADIPGMGLVKILRTIISTSLSSGPGAAKVFATLFRSFPVHASPQQVEALHLVLIEHTYFVVEQKMTNGSSVALCNCIGVCSVLLNELIYGFLTSECIHETVKLSLSVLSHLTLANTDATKALSNNELSLALVEASHIARLACFTALRVSRPVAQNDRGDVDLQFEVLDMIDANLTSLLLVPSNGSKVNVKIPSGPTPKPVMSAKSYPLWKSCCLSRCSSRSVLFPDLCESENPEIASIAPLLISLHYLLLDHRDDVRSLSISIFVTLLQHRPKLMSDLLVADVDRGDKVETIDVVNRGGFRALLAIHEAAIANDKKTGTAGVSVKRKYSAFFDWFDRNLNDVQLVFDAIAELSQKLYPGLDRTDMGQDDVVEAEQKLMLMKLTSQGVSDRTILGGLERTELSKRCVEKTSENHVQWKRQGFDDLAYGAAKWKVLLRRLKGCCLVWEGGYKHTDADNLVAEKCSNVFIEKTSLVPQIQDNVRYWKLDLSEGYERQRRRLLPNFEFQGLYNLTDTDDALTANEVLSESHNNVSAMKSEENLDFIVSSQMEATTELLKDLNIKRTHQTIDEYDDEDIDDDLTAATTLTSDSVAEEGVSDKKDKGEPARQEPQTLTGPSSAPFQDANQDSLSASQQYNEHSSNYRLISGMLQAGDWPERSYNVKRCTGLEVTKALMLWCQDAIYVIDGFEQAKGVGGKITRIDREQSSFHVNLRTKRADSQDSRNESDTSASLSNRAAQSYSETNGSNANSVNNNTTAATAESSDIIYRHRSQRISFSELYSVFRRRYQLQQNALEFYDVNHTATLLAFENHRTREDVLTRVLQSKLPNSIFSPSYGTYVSYTKFISSLKSKVVSQWSSGKMTNFEFLMHLNSFAGRSFNDLTQYPVFPWIISDYDSEEIDLSDPNVYRDLSKPMGAIGEDRAQQFRERYEALASTNFSEDDPPPFHYGTHYSCAAYVLYYLMRLEPFSRLALALQGGRFDVADRLFHDIGRSWKSASTENLQDVRELIPEFFFLPEFLVNSNDFDFGETQKGKTVNDVSLPKWAKGDPSRFVRINRQALESEYVSQNLHKWVDLVFGYKQRGQEAVKSLNTFVHVTYEGEVDIDTMTDPIQRASTIAQIQNFGQTPSRLERKPFPQKAKSALLKQNNIDFGGLSSMSALTPPFCVVGAPHRISISPVQTDTCSLGLFGNEDASVGDLCYTKGQFIGVGRFCSLIVNTKKFIKYGGINNGISIYTAATTTRSRESNKLLSIHDALHRAPVSAVKASINGDWVATGCIDSSVRVWKYDDQLSLRATLCGHDGSPIKCIDFCTEYGILVTGCKKGRIVFWDLRSLTFVRKVYDNPIAGGILSVSINHRNGYVVTLTRQALHLYSINGDLIATQMIDSKDPACCAVSTDCAEWMENGIVAVSGHYSGELCFWSALYDEKCFKLRHTLSDNPHTVPITTLCVTGTERHDTLLVGDESGKMSVCKTVQLESFSPEELKILVKEIQMSDKPTSMEGVAANETI